MVLPSDYESKGVVMVALRPTDLGTLCPGDKCLSHVAGGEHGRSLDVIPILLLEGVIAAIPVKMYIVSVMLWSVWEYYP